jgi:hypothetical protein
VQQNFFRIAVERERERERPVKNEINILNNFKLVRKEMWAG